MSSSTQHSRVTIDDALEYLRKVKERFKYRPHKYQRFLRVLMDFKATRIDTQGVVRALKKLFRGHRDIILDFNKFLPKEYEILLPLPPENSEGGENEEAIILINKIKARFQVDSHVYKSFLQILITERNKISMVYDKVALLFREHDDLFDEFCEFLPGYPVPAKYNKDQNHSIATTCGICLADFMDGELCQTLPICQHIFHSLCIKPWLIKTQNCPFCRRYLPTYAITL